MEEPKEFKKVERVVIQPKFIPHDQWGHSYGLLPITGEIVSNSPLSATFNSLIGSQILLVNIGEKVLHIEQEKMRILTIQFDMARRSPKYYGNTFLKSYYSWKHRMQLTRAKDGFERNKQGEVSGNYQTRGMTQGYQGYMPESEVEKKEKDLFASLFGGGQKQQQQQQR